MILKCFAKIRFVITKSTGRQKNVIFEFSLHRGSMDFVKFDLDNQKMHLSDLK